MRRRQLIILLGGTAMLWPFVARAQQQIAKLPTIGFLGASTPSNWTQWTTAFVQRLRELGWIDGRTVTLEYRWAEGGDERYAEIANEFVRLKVDVIITVGSAVLAAKRATSTIPIVFAIAVDPVGSGMVASLARPGGNVTGLSVQSVDLAGKRLELLRGLIPDLHRVAVIADVSYPASVLEIGEVQKAGLTLGIEIEVLEIRRADDIVPAFGTLKSGTQALYLCADALINANHARINTLALGARLPTMHAFRDFLGAGGFMSYGAHTADMFRRAGDFVDKILKGAKRYKPHQGVNSCVNQGYFSGQRITSGPAARTAAFRGRIHGCTRTLRANVRFFSLAPRVPSIHGTTRPRRLASNEVR